MAKNLLEKQPKEKKQKKEKGELPVYEIGARKNNSLRKKILIPIIFVGLLLAIIYLPPLIVDEPVSNGYKSVRLAGDSTSLQDLVTYKSNAVQDDFDNDGLINDIENQLGTSIYVIDHDNDGVSDGAELYINNPETNPKIADTSVADYIERQDVLNGIYYNTPFMDAGVTLWADDYLSQARGSVMQVYNNVYMFSNFKGYAAFPNNAYAYQVFNGYQIPLEQNSQGYYHIDASESYVYCSIYFQQPETCGRLRVFGHDYKISEGLTSFLSAILPNKGVGILTCQKVLADDFAENSLLKETIKQNPSQYCDVATLDVPAARFARDYNQISDFRDLTTHLDNGDVAIVSLISSKYGEAYVEVVGYSSHNNLIVCDTKTGENYGVIQINLESNRLLDMSGSINRYEFFTFNGCGFATATRDRIAIIAYIAPDGTITKNIADTENQEPLPEEIQPEENTEPIEETTEEQPFEITSPTVKAVLYPDFGEEHKMYISEDHTKIHRVLYGVSQEQFAEHADRIANELKFNCYYSTEGSQKKKFDCITMCNKAGDIVFLKYNTEQGSLVLRYEDVNAEHNYVDEDTGYALVLKDEYRIVQKDEKTGS